MTQFTLKLIAMFAMLMDHTAKIVLHTGVLSSWVGMENEMLIRDMMIVVGRLAFPIFAWFVAEGCCKTSNMGKYALRMLGFAILSELPFQLCSYETVELGCHNVMFTLVLAVGAVYLGQLLEAHAVPQLTAKLIPACIAIVLGWVLHTDYNAWGVALVLGLYYMPNRKGQLLYLSAWITLFQLVWHGWNGTTLSWLSGEGSIEILNWIGAMFSVPLLMTYNGQHGRSVKWLFYVFYPVHLMLIFLIARAL